MVKVRAYRKGKGFEVDIRMRLPDGSRYRERVKAPVSSQSAAQRWAEAREREIAQRDFRPKKKEVPTLAQFEPKFIEWAKGEKQKPSAIEAKRGLFRVHLIPLLGEKRLDEITNVDVAGLKARFHEHSASTTNNALSALSGCLKVAVELEVLDRMPCTIGRLKIPKTFPRYFEFEEYERLVDAARQSDPGTYVVVLLGGDAGLRAGEILALEWPDVVLSRGLLKIERSDWRGRIVATKGNESRPVPTTKRLLAALKSYRHLRGPYILSRDGGRRLTMVELRSMIEAPFKRANLRPGLHVLRHTFCSHLAMKGAPVGAIQALAGHKSVTTTERYMHLSPRTVEAAIRLLDEPGRGEIVETAPPAGEKEAQPGSKNPA